MRSACPSHACTTRVWRSAATPPPQTPLPSPSGVASLAQATTMSLSSVFFFLFLFRTLAQAIATGLGRLLLRTGRANLQDQRDARRAARPGSLFRTAKKCGCSSSPTCWPIPRQVRAGRRSPSSVGLRGEPVRAMEPAAAWRTRPKMDGAAAPPRAPSAVLEAPLAAHRAPNALQAVLPTATPTAPRVKSAVVRC